MKKIQFWSLFLGLTFGSLAFTACSSDDDESGNDGGGAITSLEGTWKSVHQGERGVHITNIIVFGADGSYEDRHIEVLEVASGPSTKMLETDETVTKGTYKKEGDKYMVQITESWKTVNGELKKDDTFKPTDAKVFPYQAYSNGFLTMTQGGINYFVPEGKEREIISVKGHEMVGRWEIHQPWEGQPNRETVRYIELTEDGMMKEGGEQWATDEDRMFQGSESKGFFVVLDSKFADMLVGSDVKIPEGGKLVSFIEDVSYYYETTGTSAAWKFSAARPGGHPNQYVIKDGKLYFGVIGQSEEYFFSEDNAFTKKKE